MYNRYASADIAIDENSTFPYIFSAIHLICVITFEFISYLNGTTLIITISDVLTKCDFCLLLIVN